MNKHLKRFIETTLPMVIGYGLVVSVTTHFVGFYWSLIAIIIFAIIDAMMVR